MQNFPIAYKPPLFIFFKLQKMILFFVMGAFALTCQCMNRPIKKTYLTFAAQKADFELSGKQDPLTFSYSTAIESPHDSMEIQTTIKALKEGYNNYVTIKVNKKIVPITNKSKTISWLDFSIDNKSKAICYLNFIKTNEEFQNQGFASLLLDDLENELRECQCAKQITLLPNDAVEEFYLKRGYQKKKNGDMVKIFKK